jgi:hypothetical protein
MPKYKVGDKFKPEHTSIIYTVVGFQDDGYLLTFNAGIIKCDSALDFGWVDENCIPVEIKSTKRGYAHWFKTYCDKGEQT